MGRTIPMINQTSSSSSSSDYDLLSLSLFLAFMAAIIAISAGLCGTRSRKKHVPRKDVNIETYNPLSPPPLPPPRDQQENLESIATKDLITTKTSLATTTIGGEDEVISKPLPPPPAATAVDSLPLDRKKKKPNIDKSSSLHNYMSSKTSRRKLSTGSISMRMPAAVMSMKRKEHSVEEDQHVHDTTISKDEESLWTKKILLGEKCRLHEEDEVSDGVDDTRKRVCSPTEEENGSVSMSRSNSSIEEQRTSSKVKESESSSDGSVR